MAIAAGLTGREQQSVFVWLEACRRLHLPALVMLRLYRALQLRAAADVELTELCCNPSAVRHKARSSGGLPGQAGALDSLGKNSSETDLSPEQGDDGRHSFE